MLTLKLKEDMSLNIIKIFILLDKEVILEYNIQDPNESLRESETLKELMFDGVGNLIFDNGDILTISTNRIELELVNMYFSYKLSQDEHEQFLQEIIVVLSHYVF